MFVHELRNAKQCSVVIPHRKNKDTVELKHFSEKQTEDYGVGCFNPLESWIE